jgi:hypothetical protein
MTIRRLTVVGFGAACLLLAGGSETRQKVQVTSTQRMDFPAGGTLRLKNSVGVLTVEAWDRPDVEITTIKSTKIGHDALGREKATHDLESVRVSAERRGDELVITTDSPRHWPFPPPNLLDPLAEETNFDLEYRIKAPSAARLIAEHGIGEVNIDGLTGDIQVTLRQGEILLHLPEQGRYDIHAKSGSGAVNSDFPGEEKRSWWLVGHRAMNQDSQAPHRLDLRVKFGDIVILKTRVPKTPEPMILVPKANGL